MGYGGGKAILRDIDELKAAVGNFPGTEVFMPAVAPASVVLRSWSDVYASEEAFLFALAEALREEYRAIVDAGLILQIDNAYLATLYDVMVPPSLLAGYRRWAELRVGALNHALEGIPESRTRYHGAGGAGMARTRMTFPSRRLSTWYFACASGATPWRWQTRDMSTSGEYGRRSSYLQGACFCLG